MGAEIFEHLAFGKTPEEAFQSAREEAWYDHGHSGYTGTIAEKDDFIMIKLKKDEDINNVIDREVDDGGAAEDKWGPAGCIEVTGESHDKDKLRSFVFFGWASC